jgi:hypothetical protein
MTKFAKDILGISPDIQEFRGLNLKVILDVWFPNVTMCFKFSLMLVEEQLKL